MSTKSPTAAIVIIGNEVLSGKVTDLNTPFLTGELRKLGVRLCRVVVIPDEIDIIAAEVRLAAEQFDWVFTSGGLGPTHDDVTMEAVAQAFQTKLVQSAELVDQLHKLRPGKKRDALEPLTWIPENSSLFWGEGEQIWPTVHVDNVYIFPGVPTFLQFRFNAMRTELQAQPFTSHSVYCSKPESELVDEINTVVDSYSDVDIGSYPKFGNEDHRLRVTFDALDASRARGAAEQFLSLLEDELVVRIEWDPAHSD